MRVSKTNRRRETPRVHSHLPKIQLLSIPEILTLGLVLRVGPSLACFRIFSGRQFRYI